MRPAAPQLSLRRPDAGCIIFIIFPTGGYLFLHLIPAKNRHPEVDLERAAQMIGNNTLISDMAIPFRQGVSTIMRILGVACSPTNNHPFGTALTAMQIWGNPIHNAFSLP